MVKVNDSKSGKVVEYKLFSSKGGYSDKDKAVLIKTVFVGAELKVSKNGNQYYTANKIDLKAYNELTDKQKAYWLDVLLSSPRAVSSVCCSMSMAKTIEQEEEEKAKKGEKKEKKASHGSRMFTAEAAKEAKEQVKADYKDGIYTEAEYKAEIKRINARIGEWMD